MAKADELRALIARVEQATGPDRELDALISVSVGRHETHIENRVDGTSKLLPWRGDGTGSYNIECRRYTGSLDAAVSLVPSGWGWEIWNTPGEKTICYVWQAHRRITRTTCTGRCATPALALTAAALRARLAMEEQA